MVDCLQVRGELQKEREEKVDLVTEKVRAEEEISTLNIEIQQATEKYNADLAAAHTKAENSPKIDRKLIFLYFHNKYSE